MNISTASACMEVSTASVLVFLDAHCFPRPGWLEALLEVLHYKPNCIVVPVIAAAGNPSVKGFGMTLEDRAFHYRWLQQRAETPYEIPIACGCCLAVRRETFVGNGGRLPAFLEYLRQYPEFDAAEKLLLASDVWQRAVFVRERRKHEIEWFFRRFDIAM